MRKTISTVTDSGGVREYIKMKPDNVATRGIATIQMFEEDKLVKEMKVENVIGNAPKHRAYMNTYYHGIKSGNTSPSTDYYANMMLIHDTSDYKAENPDRKYIDGSMLGYCTSRNTYSGSAINRGTLNQAETDLTKVDENGNAIFHFVFDFPTHACNGTFNKIYWTGNTNYINMVHDKIIDSGTEKLNSQGNIHVDDTYIYVSYRGTSKNFNVYDRVTGELIYSTAIDLNTSNFFAILSDGDYVYLKNATGGNGPNNGAENKKLLKLRKGTWEIVENRTLSVGYNPTSMCKWNGKYYGICYASRGNYSSNREFIEISPDFNSYTVIADITAGYDYGRKALSVMNGKLVMSSGNDLSYYDEEVKNFVLLSVDGPSGWGAVFDPVDVGRVYRVYGNSPYYLGAGSATVLMGADNLLPEPVTKTAINTMKIQYDFVVESVLYVN